MMPMQKQLLTLACATLLGLLLIPAPAQASAVAACESLWTWNFDNGLDLFGSGGRGTISGSNTCVAVAASGSGASVTFPSWFEPGLGFSYGGSCLLATGTTDNGFGLIFTPGQVILLEGLQTIIVGHLVSNTGNPCDVQSAFGPHEAVGVAV
jgi:hypothetical protein